MWDSDTSTEEHDAEHSEDYQKQLEDAPPSMSESPHTPDEPVEVPPVQAPVAGEVIDPGEESYEAFTVEELKAEADQRDLTVTRGDGESGDPVKADYVAALEADDKE